MEFNPIPRYQAALNDTYPATQESSSQSAQINYPYATHSLPGYTASTSQPQMARSSPPQSTWAVPQAHTSYYPLPQTPADRDNYQISQARASASMSNSPALANVPFTDSVNMSGMPATSTYFPNVMENTSWMEKPCDEVEPFPSLDADVVEYSNGLMAHDENTPIIDLRQYSSMGHQDAEGLANSNGHSVRRISESSFSISSTGGVLPEPTTYEELGSSEAVAYAPEYEVWGVSEPVTTHLLSPIASPRRTQHDHVVRTGSRSRASPAPHTNVRSSPYTLESNRLKRWSTGHAPTSTPAGSRSSIHVPDQYAPYGPRSNAHHSMPIYPPSAYQNFGMPAQQMLYSPSQAIASSNAGLFTAQGQACQLEVPRPLPSQGLFRLLQSNADHHFSCSSHFADLSDPPDLYSSLHEEQSSPPESDMNPSDPDLIPHEQDLRFTGDLYTPRWVRGHGNKREGWCGLCKPGRWLVLKNSAFWYDKSFTHGVSAATGAAFQGPQETRRTEGNLDVWEGLCGSCGEWIALVSSKKKGTTWFRHAYKCHTHPKVKDGPKRRRETQVGRARAISSASAASSTYPVKHEVSQSDGSGHRHMTPTPSSAGEMRPMQPLGMPRMSSAPLPTSTPTVTPLMSAATFSNATSYPTPTSMSMTPTMNALQTPTQATFNDLGDSNLKHEPVTPFYGTPLQRFNTFPTSQPTSYSDMPHLSHQISEPEPVGIVAAAPIMNSIASMI